MCRVLASIVVMSAGIVHETMMKGCCCRRVIRKQRTLPRVSLPCAQECAVGAFVGVGMPW